METTVSSQDIRSMLQQDDEAFAQREKQRQRECERASREKRRGRTDAMRKEVVLLERLELAVQVASDPDAVWDEFLDVETKHLRGLLRRLMPAAQEIKQLLHEHQQLHELLAEHELARNAVTELVVTAGHMDDWEATTQQWKALARQHFQPLDILQCATHMNAALKKVEEFSTSRDCQTTGLEFMGWRDSRRLDVGSSTLEYTLDKVYYSHNMDHCVDTMWRVFAEQDLYSSLVLGGRGRVSVDILQVIAPTVCVIRYAGAYDDLPVIVHELYLFFRIEIDGGVLQYLMAIEDSALQHAFSSPVDVWVSNNIWIKWDVLDTARPRSSTDCRVKVGGSLHGGNHEYLNRWLFERLATMIRLEAVGTSRRLLDFS